MLIMKRNPSSFEESGLNWKLEVRSNTYPIFQMNEGSYILDDKGKRIVDNTKIGTGHATQNIVRMDNQVCVGTMKGQYKIIQNSATWDALHEALAGVKFDIVGSGYTGVGQQTFIQAKVDGDDFKIDGDAYSGYITIFNSHDGSCVCKIGDTYIRVICHNSLMDAYQSKHKAKVVVRHTSNASIKFEGMMRVLEERYDHRKAFIKNIERLANTPITDNNAKLYSLGYMNSTATRSQNKANQVHGLFRKGKGNKGKTLYDLFNGFTEFYTHGDLSIKRDKKATDKFTQDQWRSSEMGASAKVKIDVFNRLLNNDSIAETISRGKTLRKEIARQS